MKTARTIKLTLFLGGFVVSMSQVPRMVEMVDGIRSGDPLSGMGGISGTERAFGLLGDLQSQGLTQSENASDRAPALRVFSPEGTELTAEQRAELLAAAERLRPRVAGRDGQAARPADDANAPVVIGRDVNSVLPGAGQNVNIDAALLRQLESLQQTEALVKELTKVGGDQ